MSRPSVTNRPFSPTDGSLANDPMYYMEKLFVYFLQNLFRDFPEGQGIRWSPEEEATELIITSQKPELTAIEKMPHIVCVTGAARWANLGLDQLQGMTFATGQRKHTDLMPMTMAYHCQARNGLVARRIAWNASYYTNILRRILMRAGGLHHVAPNHEITPESGPTAFTGPVAKTEIVSVVVTVPFYWQPQWIIKDPANLWRRVQVTMNVYEAEGIYHASRINELRPPRVNGRVVRTEPIVDGPPDEAFTQVVIETDDQEE